MDTDSIMGQSAIDKIEIKLPCWRQIGELLVDVGDGIGDADGGGGDALSSGCQATTVSVADIDYQTI